MQVQRLSLPSYTLSLPNVSQSKRLSTKLLTFNPHSTSGFCNSAKVMFKSPTGARNYGDLVGVRCEVAQQEDRDDEFYMRRCVELARKAIGHTSPNPIVGCVIVKDGKVVGEGFHPKDGQPHAEVFALRDAGDLAENATAYVSLEPCNHYGRTPPCTEALIKAKVKRVVVGMVDPNPIVASKGLDRLRDAGIDVITGVEEKLCTRLSEAYIHHMLTGNPFVTLRYSISANGHFLDQLGEGVTELGGYYSQLLQEYDAIILSSATVTENNSLPASQEAGANQPLRIIIASSGSSIQIPGLTMEPSGKLIIFADNETTVELESTQTGIETVVLDQINLNAITEYCKSQGFCSVLLDLRGNMGDFEKVLQDGTEQNLQKIVIEVLPIWDQRGGGDFPIALKSLSKRVEVKNLQAKISNQNVVLEGYL
ncbi:putative diaminohydroxyphosphoribosylaminopyrimidine deaminase [Rosa chinensis]|uniref:Riboflavin biosynthesis protein PYRD, chloroplastic n=1 Tax=Rosa chinensis TaxID=74649 RepID=A0A2P6RSX6_ROSCH|nr:riboflavin biosynthesis protein PYRD, chloroplastic [Rosa chinensis]XP_024177876.1 riboflavin biosynthesis protein PYRD, chloroplastic [Rosa chinensis]XP_024177878.1 riboflavin biosynthesis protein PYRD, chloroplastic [Rosa chinensis]PRQ49533.1 putative diaminohydroxyphosphoribosylaminopyrimidine deaminase [Rosa chinensis]